MSYNYIIKEDMRYRLEAYHESDVEIKRYFPIDKFELNHNFLQNEKIFIDDAPKLKIPNRSFFGKFLGKNKDDYNEYDLDNAIMLYEAMRLNRVQASDPRLWAYLCHGPYYEFVKSRYAPNKDGVSYDLKNFYNETPEIQTTMRNYIKNRFFSSGIREIRRNGLASLWWACDLTYAPWNKYSELKKGNKDDYHYTRIILENPNIYQQTFERTYGRETVLVFHLLDFIYNNKLGRNDYEKLIKKLNSNLSFNIFSIQSPKEIKANIEQLAVI